MCVCVCDTLGLCVARQCVRDTQIPGCAIFGVRINWNFSHLLEWQNDFQRLLLDGLDWIGLDWIGLDENRLD